MKEALIPMVSESQMNYQIQQPSQQHFNTNQNFNNARPVPSSGGVVDRNSASFDNLVEVEMNSLLNEMYNEMGITNRMTLDQLLAANQSLWMQIKNKAEENTMNKFNARQSLQQQQQSIAASGGTRFGAKRSHLDHIAEQMTHSNEMSSDVSHNQAKLARTTLDNTAMNRSIPMQQQQQQQQQYADSRGMHSQPRVMFNDQIASNNSSMENNHNNGLNSVSSYVDRTFISGFVSEIPVVVDMDRVRSVAGQMADNYQLCEPVMSVDFQSVALAAASRLDCYIQNAMDPPDLPRILFGPLPLEPVTKAASEALAQLNAEIKPVVHRLPMPVFRSEELGRNPEKAIRALYGDRPLQFAEDGLRFATQYDLKQHSDAVIARRLHRTKPGGLMTRESREWYCSCSQWVSDFNSLSLSSGHSTGAGVSGAGEVSSSGSRSGAAAALEGPASGTSAGLGSDGEYIVAADEHFTRCPISREMFETTFDAVEGAMLCRNAVKVMVPPPTLLGSSSSGGVGGGSGVVGDMDSAAVYALGRPVEEEPEVRYLIVHKYVMDRWLAQGQAVRFSQAIDRFQQLSGGGERVIELLKRAAEVEDEEDLFVKL